MKKKLTFLGLLLLLFYFNGGTQTFKGMGASTDISVGAGWRLWPDTAAEWRNDSLFLPSEVHLSSLQVHAPSGGWNVLNSKTGIAVLLPSTVEEHFWGKLGLRPYTKYEAQRGAGTSFPNGNYLGVSWWWREISVPEFRKDQRLKVAFRAARLRAEVYCNGKLCGYSIMGELPFEADITDAVKAGKKAVIAVRITNPGGHLDWIDFAQMQIRWGKYTLPPSHGFGGLDNDIQLSVRDQVAITDIAAINLSDLHRVRILAEVSSDGKAYSGPVQFSIVKGGKIIWQGERNIVLNAGTSASVAIEAMVSSAEKWDVAHPVLYQAGAVLKGLSQSGKRVNFGFRYFTAEGIGSEDAMLRLNGKRSVPISAISWGYWGRNGLWPDKDMAEREVSAAKAMGLNCLQFHRNIGRPAVLDIQDKIGLMRAEEPGGGKFALGARYAQGPFGPNDEFLTKDEELLNALKPKKDYVKPEIVNTSGNGPDGDGRAFWEKYEEEKILMMVKRDRSHPSLIMYTIQNESSDLDIRNPRIYRLFREMHALDPGRLIAFYSGGVPKDGQILMLPDSDSIIYATSGLPYAGWRDVHTCGGPCNYLDFLYKNPTDFRQRQKEEDRKSICMWGEMLGAAAPDNYDQLVHSFKGIYPTGYELEDSRKVLNGYHTFLDKWGFRKAFPTDSSLFTSIGSRTYYFWKRIVEQTRMDNANDYLVISGWESTSIDNHSGLVDNHRFFKSNPALIAKACQPEVLVIQPRHMIVNKGDLDIADIFIINETDRKGPQMLKLVVRRPDGSVISEFQKEVNVQGGDVYGQLLAEGIEFKADVAGMLKLEASLIPVRTGAKTLRNTDEVHVVDVANVPVLQKVAVIETDNEVSQTLKDVFHITSLKYKDIPAKAGSVDAIVLATKIAGTDLFKTDALSQPIAVSHNLIPESLTLAQDNKPGKKAETNKNPENQITKEVFDNALEKVKNDGVRLILWPDNEKGAEAFAKELARRGIVQFKGRVGNLNAPWFGSWFFGRKHWLLQDLPVDCAMDWRYGISAFGGPEWLKENPKGTSTNGMLLEGKGVEAVIGFGADHNTNVGISACVIPYGKGQILLYCLPQMVRSLLPGEFAINQFICQRLLGNSLRIASACK